MEDKDINPRHRSKEEPDEFHETLGATQAPPSIIGREDSVAFQSYWLWAVGLAGLAVLVWLISLIITNFYLPATNQPLPTQSIPIGSVSPSRATEAYTVTQPTYKGATAVPALETVSANSGEAYSLQGSAGTQAAMTQAR